jgi:hypothetical protein
MPNLVTHSLFADEICDSLQDPGLHERLHLMEIGSSGPDFLFFHRMPSIAASKKDSLPRLGVLLHHEKINDFYCILAREIHAQKNRERREDMFAYAIGHLCHWALDSTMHPYIFYRTGNCKGRSAWMHHRFESLLDTFMLKIKKDADISTINPAYAYAHPSLHEQKVIASLYQPALNELFGTNVRKADVAKALQDWHRMQKIFNDPSSRKGAVLKTMEKLSGNEFLFSGYLIPVQAKDNADIFNLLHKTWKNPVSGIESSQSVFDLWQEAKERALGAIALFARACSDPDDHNLEKLREFLGDRAYDYGVANDRNAIWFSNEKLDLD